MSILSQTEHKCRRREYNPAPIRRCPRLIEIDASGVAHFSIYSMTRAGKDICHHPAIDTQTYECRCDCEDYTFTKAHLAPSVYSDPSALCKHIRRCIPLLQKRGALLPGMPCIKCGAMDADNYFDCTEATGNVVIGKICDCCAGAIVELDTEVVQAEIEPPQAHRYIGIIDED